MPEILDFVLLNNINFLSTQILSLSYLPYGVIQFSDILKFFLNSVLSTAFNKKRHK